MATKKAVQCTSCKFTNRLGDARCLICKAPLPQVETVAKDEPPPRPGARPGVGEEPTEPRGKAEPKRIDERATAAVSRVELGIPPPQERGKPTSRVSVADVVDPAKIIAWLCCDPLPPIPLGPKPMLVIGRHADCDLVLPHKEVSRKHAVIKIRGASMVLEDEGSSNGCYVNGSRASGQVLKVGDVITVGPYEVEIRSKDALERPAEGQDTTSNLELTSVSRLSPLAAMTGKLEEVPLMELLQGIEFNKKTGTLTVESGKERGQLLVAEGAPIRASWSRPALQDEAAVLYMLTLLRGRFTFSGACEPAEKTVRSTLTGLLLEASRRIDEGETARRDEGPPAEAPKAGAEDEAGFTLEE